MLDLVGFNSGGNGGGYAGFLRSSAEVNLGTAFNPEWNRPWSFSAWVKFSPDLDRPILLNSEGPGGGLTPYLFIEPAIMGLVAADGSALEVEAAAVYDIADDEFHHIGGSYDGSGHASGMKMRLDGEPLELTVLVDTLSGASTVSPSPSLMGANGGGSFGYVKGLAIYDGTVLSDAQFLAIKNLGLTGDLASLDSEPNLSYWYKLNGNAIDSKGGNDGVATDVAFLDVVVGDLLILDTVVMKAANVASVQLGSLEYAPQFGSDLKFFLNDTTLFMNESFKAYLVQQLTYFQVSVFDVSEILDKLSKTYGFSVGDSNKVSQGLIQ